MTAAVLIFIFLVTLVTASVVERYKWQRREKENQAIKNLVSYGMSHAHAREMLESNKKIEKVIKQSEKRTKKTKSRPVGQTIRHNRLR